MKAKIWQASLSEELVRRAIAALQSLPESSWTSVSEITSALDAVITTYNREQEEAANREKKTATETKTVCLVWCSGVCLWLCVCA